MRHAGAEESTLALGLQQLLGRTSNCNEPGSWRKVLIADLAVAHWLLGMGDSHDRRNSLVHNWEGSLLSHDHSGHKSDHSIVEARGRRPATPRESPRFRTRWASAICVLLGLGDDVPARWGVGDELTASVRTLAAELQLSVDVDSRYEALRRNPRDQFHPDTRPSFLRSRREDPSTRGYHSRMSVKPGLQFRKNLRRPRWRMSDQNQRLR